MLYNLLFPLADDISVFNLFRYITLRTGGATERVAAHRAARP